MSVKDFFVKKMMQRQMKNVPAGEREKFMRMFEKNPELFKKIAKETEEETKRGANQMHAMMKVASRYKKELQELGREE